MTLFFSNKIKSAFGIIKNRFKILSMKPRHPFLSQVGIVLSCTVLLNYISVVNACDKFLNKEVIIPKEHGGFIDDDDDIIVNFSNNMTTRQRVEARDEWKHKRDQMAWDKWVDYCARYKRGDTREEYG